MTKKNHLQDYQLFYMEIPSQASQELEDIEIIDAAEEAPQRTGLSEDQVSKFSNDILERPSQTPSAQPSNSSNQRQLFDN